MADEKQTETAATEPETAEATFNHQVSRKQYIQGLKAEYRNATEAKHKAAIKAELDAVNGERAVQDPKEQA